MSRRSDVRRQLFRGLTRHSNNNNNNSNNPEDTSMVSNTSMNSTVSASSGPITQNPPGSSSSTGSGHLISKYLKRNNNPLLRFDEFEQDRANQTLESLVLHKPVDYDYSVFSNGHPLRGSKIKAFEQAEKTTNVIFANEESSDEETDDILISIPGYSRSETAQLVNGGSDSFNTVTGHEYEDQENISYSRLAPSARLNRIFQCNSVNEFTVPEIEYFETLNREFQMELTNLQRKNMEVNTRVKVNEFMDEEELGYLGVIDELRGYIREEEMSV